MNLLSLKSFTNTATILILLLLLTLKAQANTIWSADKRFKDSGNQTILDTKTGLIWMKEDSYLQSGHWNNWFESIKLIKQMNKKGFANQYDWQIPTIKELTTIYEANKTNSKVLGSGMKIHIDPIFATEGSGNLWSIEENGYYNAFGIVLNTGKRFNSSKKSKFRKAFRAVRHSN